MGHLTKKTCSKPACEESISTIERRLLQREKLTAWPKCSGYIGARAIEQVKVIPKGVLISGVDPNYSAARIGIKKGDIIVRIGGQDVGSRKRLSGEIARRSFGDAIELQLYRQGRLLRMKGTIGTKAGRPYFGIYMKELPKGFIVPAGVVVAPVPDGAAKAAGLPTGARVVSIGGRPVFRLAKYREVLKKQFGKVVEIVAVSKTGEFRTYSVPVGPVAR